MKTVVFWGAGATASLGIRTTVEQSAFVRNLAPVDEIPLDKRVSKALLREADRPDPDDATTSCWHDALRDLLTILGDSRSVTDATDVDDGELEALQRHWEATSDAKLRRRVLHLRATYDWPALKEIIKACPGSRQPTSQERFKINDLFNIMDLHDQSGHGFHAGDVFLTPQQVGSAKNALKMLLHALFFIDWQLASVDRRRQLDLHHDFACVLAKRMQRAGVKLSDKRYESPDFYAGDVSFASMNYDPVGLWCQTVANRELNHSPVVPHIGYPARKLEVFLDPAHFVASNRIGENEPRIWHSMSEAVVQRLNEAGHRIRVTKYLSPHGCLCWRECPDCGKLSNYWGHSWDLNSRTLIPPPPLRAFAHCIDFNARTEKESDAWKEGKADARECLHCGTLTYTHHTSTQMQSSFKERPPSFIEEIQRELRVVVKKAGHIVLMGYSLPRDDVIYRAFFAAHRSDSTPEVKCTVVDKKDRYKHWLGPKELDRLTDPHLYERTAVGAARDLFGRENVRFYGGGVPDVFLDNGTVQDRAVERLLVWS